MNTMFDLSGKVAIVTGGNGGIGLGIAKGLAISGAAVVVSARDSEKTQRAVWDLQSLGARATGIGVDVASEASVVSMVRDTLEELGRIDILVNNAGMTIRKAPQEYTLEEWEMVVDVNLNGSYLCAREVYAPMVEAGGGKIINIGSMTSIFGSDWVSAYSASKGAVVQMTKSLAVAWAKDNIQVNSILPGWIHTNLTVRDQDEDARPLRLHHVPDPPRPVGLSRTSSPGRRSSSPPAPRTTSRARRSPWTAATPRSSAPGAGRSRGRDCDSTDCYTLADVTRLGPPAAKDRRPD